MKLEGQTIVRTEWEESGENYKIVSVTVTLIWFAIYNTVSGIVETLTVSTRYHARSIASRFFYFNSLVKLHFHWFKQLKCRAQRFGSSITWVSFGDRSRKPANTLNEPSNSLFSFSHWTRQNYRRLQWHL